MQIHTLTSCHIGSSGYAEASYKMKTAYASHSHHNMAKFSFVAISGETDNGSPEEWIGRVIAFMKFSVKNGTEQGKLTWFSLICNI